MFCGDFAPRGKSFVWDFGGTDPLTTVKVVPCMQQAPSFANQNVIYETLPAAFQTAAAIVAPEINWEYQISF